MNNIRSLREKQHISAKELGRAIGKSQPTISKWENAPQLRYEQAKKIADYFKVSIYEVTGQKNEEYLQDIAPTMVALDILFFQNGEKKILGKQIIPTKILQEYTLTAPHNIKIIRINQEAMKPTININDMIWIDTSYKFPNSDGIYLINIGNTPMLKRIQIKPFENSAIIKSDNPQDETFIYPNYHQLSVLGKVIFHLQKL